MQKLSTKPSEGALFYATNRMNTERPANPILKSSWRSFLLLALQFSSCMSINAASPASCNIEKNAF